MSKELTQIPRFKLKTERIATKAEVDGCYCFKGIVPMTEYCINDQNTLILTRNNGYLVVPHDDLSALIGELQELKADLERIKRVVS